MRGHKHSDHSIELIKSKVVISVRKIMLFFPFVFLLCPEEPYAYYIYLCNRLMVYEIKTFLPKKQRPFYAIGYPDNSCGD